MQGTPDRLTRQTIRCTLRWGFMLLMSCVASVSVTAPPAFADAAPLQDGTYLFGQAAKADRLGSDYMVFELKNGWARGAFYQPQSEFACFSGEIDRQAVRLSVRDTYSDEVSPLVLAVERTGTVADATAASGAVRLEGLQQIARGRDRLSTLDLELLATCQ